ncbi:MAG TPA: alpha/beta fold hydrolase [Gemmatimonadaceae bacterium]
MITFAIVVVACAWFAWWRAKYLRSLNEAVSRRRPLGRDGIVVGGEGFVLERTGAPAILLLHGAGDTPQTLRYLGDALHAKGFHVAAPLLPGHGRRLSAFMRVTADQLTSAARTSYENLTAQHSWVGIIGLSMGGALAVQVAADATGLPALGLVAPYLVIPAKVDRAARLSWFWGVFVPAVPSADGISVRDPVERERSLAYGVFTAAGLRALRQTVRRAVRASPRLRAPTLVIQSREDNRIQVAAAEQAFARLGASEKRLEWITGAAHIITVDYGRDAVIALLADWMQKHLPSSV